MTTCDANDRLCILSTDGQEMPIREVVFAVALLGAWSVSAIAEDYPVRPIRIVVPVPPGAAADILPRAIADRLSVRFAQPVIVENVPGANSNIGARRVATAEPDGYTLLATPAPPLVINERLYAELGFDPAAFVPITILARVANVLVVRRNASFQNLSDMLAFARANPGKLTYATAGNGSSPHLAMEWLARRTGVQMTQIPYNGLARALNDVVAGHVDVMFNNTANVLPLIRDGKLTALAVGSERRIDELQDTPAIAEAFAGFVVDTWFAIVAPANTPPDIVRKLSAAIAEALQDPSMLTLLQDLMATPAGYPPAETANFIQRERERWRKVVEEAGIQLH
jgi:tripartite-type tricarboxylate transporter receptor subunit TctC